MPVGLKGFQKNNKLALGNKYNVERNPWNKGLKYSNELKKRLNLNGLKKGWGWNKNKKVPQMSGVKHPRWKGGLQIQNGYIAQKSREHLFSNRGYVYQHRLIMERKIGRLLKPKERVHHINGIKADNRIENLMLFSNETEHQKFHHSLAGSTH